MLYASNNILSLSSMLFDSMSTNPVEMVLTSSHIPSLSHFCRTMASMSLPPYEDSMLQHAVKSMCASHKQPKPSLTGKTCLITGSNSGIGLACAQVLPSLGVTHLIMAVRSVSKGEAAAEPIRKASPNVHIEVLELDMLSYDSILAFAQGLPKLDIAILNAGTSGGAESKIHAPTGHEETIQVNYLSTALLAILLLPTLTPRTSSAPPGRLTIIGSGTALHASFANHTANPLLPSFDVPFSGFAAASERYGVSKILVMMLVHKLSEFVPSSNVIINTVEPGLTSGTQLHRGLSGGGKVFMGAMKKMTSKTPEQAAWTYVDAIGDKGEESHGGYIMDWKVCG
jgi:NAD(P)-dependent dehydrogenase (short-subunit alcohol dehydrogenase family)